MENKLFEIIVTGTSYGLYQGVDKTDAIENQTKDAGYESVADLLEKSGQNEDEFLATMKAVEIEVKGIKLDYWEDEKVAVYFSVYLDGEKTRTLEWVDEDGDLETSDSHIDSAHSFSDHLKDHIRDKLETYLDKHRYDVADLYKNLQPETEEEFED